MVDKLKMIKQKNKWTSNIEDNLEL